MQKPEDNDVLGRVLNHKVSQKSSFSVTTFSNVPDVKFTTWVEYEDENTTIWVAKPQKWFGTETKSPPLVFKISHYNKGYMEYCKATVHPYTNEMFEKENNLGFNSL